MTLYLFQQKSLFLKISNYLVRVLLRSRAVSFESNLRRDRRLIRIIHTGKAHRVAILHGLARLRIQTFYIALFTDLDGRIHIHFNEILADHLARLFAGCAVRADGRTDYRAAGMDDLSRHKADAQNVGVAIFFTESETLGKMCADHIPIEDGDLTPAFKKQ